MADLTISPHEPHRDSAPPTGPLSGLGGGTVGRWGLWLEWLSLWVLLFLYAGLPTPGVNEVHYLCKARHFWDPNWCDRDIFLHSADAHAVFYALFGWLAKFLPLDAAAWIGRLIGWGLLAFAWQRLSWACVPVRGASLVTASLFLTGLHYAHLAGEWVAGGFEAKVIAYVLVLIGLVRVVHGRWSGCWPWFGAAAAFHVLVGGWTVVASALAYAFTARLPGETLVRQIRPLVIGGAIALVGVLPALQLTATATPAEVSEGERIYVFERLSHHLVFHTFLSERIQRHGLLLILLAAVTWGTRRQPHAWRLACVALASVAIGLIGIALDQMLSHDPARAARWLKFYWFRLEDVLVPLATALLAAIYAQSLIDHPPTRAPRAGWVLAALLFLVGLAGVSGAWYEHRQAFWPEADLQSELLSSQNPPRARLDWISICEWARANTPADALFLTPLHVQTFKWYAQRAEWVSWKHIPQDPASLVEWQRRRNKVQQLAWNPELLPSLLAEIHRDDGVEYAVISASLLPYVQHAVVRTHNGTYAVLQLFPETQPSLESEHQPEPQPELQPDTTQPESDSLTPP
ncbi:MAG: DUF6798 domain-containing protein [Pirellulales bacterium]